VYIFPSISGLPNFLQNLFPFRNFPENFLLEDLVAPSGTSPFFMELLTLIQTFTEYTCFILGDLGRQRGIFNVQL
jgi:hypothetical protein